MTAKLEPQLAFSSAVFQLVQFASLPGFADWQPSLPEKLAHRLLPGVPKLGSELGVHEFDDLYEIAGRSTMLDVFRAGMLLCLLDRCLEREGDVFECGAGPGGMSLMMALLIRARGLSKRVWVFDSFEGLPAPDRAFDREYTAGACAYPIERVQALMRDHGVQDMVEIRRGWLSETLPRLTADQRFCFGHVDVDLYASANDAISALYERMQLDCAMAFDDYYDGSGGVFKAVNEAAQRLGETVHLGPSCQAFFIKGQRAATPWTIQSTDMAGKTSSVRASIEDLRQLTSYLDFLRGTSRALSKARCLLLSLLEQRLLPQPLASVRQALDAYLSLFASTPPAIGTRFPLEPGGELVFGAIS